jgi:hypothetical protein
MTQINQSAALSIFNVQFLLVRIGVREVKAGSCSNEAAAQARLHSPIASRLRKQLNESGPGFDPVKPKETSF